MNNAAEHTVLGGVFFHSLRGLHQRTVPDRETLSAESDDSISVAIAVEIAEVFARLAPTERRPSRALFFSALHCQLQRFQAQTIRGVKHPRILILARRVSARLLNPKRLFDCGTRSAVGGSCRARMLCPWMQNHQTRLVFIRNIVMNTPVY
ncbi:MAG: hypothetical protein DWI10_00655 [Planctomycetota bacterium]|nr:MAG: hypothetical protein DWI10_00655 [Planctomycetota bacterium]